MMESESIVHLTRWRSSCLVWPWPSIKSTRPQLVPMAISVAGRGDNALFTDDSIAPLHRFTGGVPRLINSLCDTALLCTFADGDNVVTAEGIVAAAEELGWKEHDSLTGNFVRPPALILPEPSDQKFTAIEVREDGELIATYKLGSGRVIVGRSPDNEIYIKSRFVSRHHVQLITSEDGCTIEDLNSTNGIFIGNQQVKKIRLSDGDKVSLGVHELIYTDLRKSAEAESGGNQDSAVNQGS